MSEPLYLLSIGLVLATILLVFGMRYVAAIQQARARLANDEAHRRIAETATLAQSGSAASLASIDARLADIKVRLTAVEKILKDVE